MLVPNRVKPLNHCPTKHDYKVFLCRYFFVVIIKYRSQHLKPLTWSEHYQTISQMCTLCRVLGCQKNEYFTSLPTQLWVNHDYIIIWRHFPRTKASDAELWCFFFICASINAWVNNRKAGDLRSHRTHYDVIVMCSWQSWKGGSSQHVAIPCEQEQSETTTYAHRLPVKNVIHSHLVRDKTEWKSIFQYVKCANCTKFEGFLSWKNIAQYTLWSKMKWFWKPFSSYCVNCWRKDRRTDRGAHSAKE